MSHVLIKDGKVVIKDGNVVIVADGGAGDCECCGGDPCGICGGTQGDVTMSVIGGGDTCGGTPTSSPCQYVPSTIPFLSFTSDDTWCNWVWKYDNYATGDPINPHVDFFVELHYNNTGSTQTWPTGCGASVPAGQFYIIITVTPHGGGGTFIRWSLLDVGASCDGGELSFSGTATQCFNNWVGCVCGTLAFSK